MKLKNLALLSLLAGAAYKLYQNREQILTTATTTKTSVTNSQNTLNTAKEQVETLKNNVTELTKFSDTLSYKLRVFQEESQPHITAITTILDKYKQADDFWD